MANLLKEIVTKLGGSKGDIKSVKNNLSTIYVNSQELMLKQGEPYTDEYIDNQRNAFDALNNLLDMVEKEME